MKQKAKILFIDVETSPNLSYIWGNYEQNALSVEKQWNIISFSAKWMGGKQVTKCLADYRSKDSQDGHLIADIWKLLDDADIVVAHNGNSFDLRKINARFVFHQLPPPSPYKTVDTLLVARKYFFFTSNHLTDLGEFMGLGKKVETGGFKLWYDCMAGDKTAWKNMKKYNAQDVKLLEKIYYRLRPWMSGHPNLGMYYDEIVCPKCGSDNIQMRGFAITSSKKYHRFQCQECGGWGRTTVSEKTTKPIVNL